MNPLARVRQLSTLRGHRALAAVHFGESTLDFATARGAGDAVSILRQSSLEVPAEGTDGKSRWASPIGVLRGKIDPREHRVLTAVAPENVFCQALSLPSTDPSELKQMLDVQIDSLTPLPLDQVVYSFEPLDVTDGQTRVLVAIARKDVVNERVELLENAGLPPEAVLFDLLAVFRALVRQGVLPHDEKLNGLIVVGAKAVHALIHSRGQPVTVRTIILEAAGLSSRETRGALREELERTLVMVRAQLPDAETGQMTFLPWAGVPVTDVEPVAAGWTPTAQLVAEGAGALPATSLCWESAGEGKPRLNLLPDEWRQRRQRTRLRRLLLRGAIAVAALYVAIIAIWGTLLLVRQAQVRRLQREAKRLQPQYASARNLHSGLAAMQKQLDTTYSALEVLREVSTLMPDSVKLNWLQFKKDQSVTLRGSAQSATAVYEFQGRLEKSPLFAKVTAGPIRGDAGGSLTRFDLTCSLKSAVASPGVRNGAK